MAVRPCPTTNVCPQIYGPAALASENFPFANLSAEAPDPPDFVSTSFPADVPDDPQSNHEEQWNNTGWTGYGDSTISQDDANQNAHEQAQGNSTIPLVGNDPQTCASRCEGGDAFQHTVPASSVFGVTKADANARALSLCQNEAAALAICFATSSLPSACADTAYNATIVAAGGIPHSAGYAYFWEIMAGVLPPGISINPITGALYGTPTIGGTYTFTVGITDGINNTASKSFTITVIQILTNSSLPSGIELSAYSQQFTNLPLTPAAAWSIASGTLPGGLSLSAGGLLSGTVSNGANGDYSFAVAATVGGKTCTKSFTLHIWDNDNTVVWNGGPTMGGSISMGSFGPGVFKLEFDAASGSAWTYGDASPDPGPCTPDQWRGIYGGPLGDPMCSDIPSQSITEVGAISGCSGRSPLGSAQASTVAFNFMVAENTAGGLKVAGNRRFELLVLTALHLSCPNYTGLGPICGCGHDVFGGGTGPIYNLIRIGKP